MGGLSYQHTRLQGRIEGSLKRFCVQHEDRARMSPTPMKPKKVPVAAVKAPSSPSPVVSVEGDMKDVHMVKESALAELFHGSKRMSVGTGSIDQTKRTRKLGDVFDRITVAKGTETVGGVVGDTQLEGELRHDGKEGLWINHPPLPNLNVPSLMSSEHHLHESFPWIISPLHHPPASAKE